MCALMVQSCPLSVVWINCIDRRREISCLAVIQRGLIRTEFGVLLGPLPGIEHTQRNPLKWLVRTVWKIVGSHYGIAQDDPGRSFCTKHRFHGLEQLIPCEYAVHQATAVRSE